MLPGVSELYECTVLKAVVDTFHGGTNVFKHSSIVGGNIMPQKQLQVQRQLQQNVIHFEELFCIHIVIHMEE